MRGYIFLVMILVFMDFSYAQDEILRTFSGKAGVTSTRPFTVPDEWEIQWNASTEMLQAFLYSSEGELVAVVANQGEAGSGSYYYPNGGRYYLQVSAFGYGTWEIRIVQIKE